MPTFYYTAHPGDLSRRRLPHGCHVMLVASAHWDDDRKRFRIRRPPADHIAGVCVDSGGFTAARRWGAYPWTAAEYAAFVRAVSRDVPLDFCACMDYACERGVNRSVLETNRQRIDATIRNEIACRAADQDLPWLPVLQGDNLEERAYDLGRRREMGLLPAEYVGIGSVCGRGAVAARNVIKFYTSQLFGVQYHAFGMHVAALDDDIVPGALKSWDSYSWTWARGARSDRAPEYRKRDDEPYAAYARRLAGLYDERVVAPRRARPVQHVL